MSKKLQLDSAITADIQAASADSYIDNLKMIDVELIEPNEGNFYELSDIDILADDIERQGLMSALVVTEQDGRFILISGHRRLAAIKLLIEDGRRRNKKVPCFIKGAKAQNESLLDLIMLNATLRRYSDADKMREYEELTRIIKELEAEGKTIKGRLREKIAKALGVSTSQVEKLDNIKHNAIPDVEQAVKNGDMTISTAHEVARLPPEKQQEIIDEKPDISHKEVKEMQKASPKPKKEAPAPAAPPPIEETEDEAEDYDEEEAEISFSNMEMHNSVTLSGEEAAALSRYIDEILDCAAEDDYKALRSIAEKLRA